MRVGHFLIFVLMLGCGKTDSAKGGKGSEVDKVGVPNTAGVMKSGPSGGTMKGPDGSMIGSQSAKPGPTPNGVKGGSTGNASNPAVVKNDAAKPVTPVVKKETPVWDWPVKAKYDIPKCRKLYFHNENLVSDIHRGSDTIVVYRYRDGKLEFKKDIWVGGGNNFWPLPDGKILYFAHLKTYSKLQGLFNIFIINEKITGKKTLHKACVLSSLDECKYFKNKGGLFYFQWNVTTSFKDIAEYEKVENWNVGAIDYEKGKIVKKQKIKELGYDSELYDWALGNVGNCKINELGAVDINKNISNQIYKNKKKIITAGISNLYKKYNYKDGAGACRNGKADLIIYGSNEKNPTNLYDDALMKLIRPFCKKFPDIWFTKYKIQNRPGGGFILLFKMGFYNGEAGSYYREYSAEGKPIGPVIKTQSEVEILSENHYRVVDGCHYEYRHRP
ncbi:hypothetical protein KKF34_00775 [Myxococcota bacterium]|nr:hypothetical protein [Myxococcota bacterium]MBU1495395.1 hypothetical protein [Myxococcota bacterium]